ncbi:Type I restriction-modification system specificity subunit [Lentisphaera araneosa HTCC2155]|uniref:Type I restriction-modification system specificity subunit n=1 Tax=Lentisphaera araneosa HTCC2155 TaxID=313628 RepID=A6DIK4_9BACT|nr:restriction endonuclease subunit S [Lentisphaera araneosa]EDM28290.1 Type I restriction-modification system specificity subunit [Lentisphaera araneosa HTCC2155]
MHNNSVEPVLRFKGLNGCWKESPLMEVADIIDGDRGSNYPSGDDLNTSGHTLFLNASNVTKSGFIFNTNQYIIKKKSDAMGNGMLSLDDIIITSRGSVGNVAWYSGEIHQEIPFARINSGMLIIRCKNMLTPTFITCLLMSPLGRRQISTITFGSAQPQLTKKDVSIFTVSFPVDKQEQAKIGKYFQQVDKLINNHQEKHKKLQNIKKAMLKKMFPQAGQSVPEIRFKGFSGDWEFQTLDEVATKHDNSRVPITAKDRIAGVTPYYGANGIQDYVEGFTHEGEYVLLAEDGANDLKNYPINYVTGKIWVNNHAHVLQGKNYKTSTLYLKYAISQIDIEPFLVGGGRAKLNASVMMNLGLSLPEKIQEQEKIGSYFKSLDNLISQHDQQIQKLQNIKQACLSKMFV